MAGVEVNEQMMASSGLLEELEAHVYQANLVSDPLR